MQDIQHVRWIIVDFIKEMEWTLEDAAAVFQLTQEKLFKITNGAHIDRRLYNKLLNIMVVYSRAEEMRMETLLVY
jgi:uncharacterized membrane protein